MKWFMLALFLAPFVFMIAFCLWFAAAVVMLWAQEIREHGWRAWATGGTDKTGPP